VDPENDCQNVPILEVLHFAASFRAALVRPPLCCHGSYQIDFCVVLPRRRTSLNAARPMKLDFQKSAVRLNFFLTANTSNVALALHLVAVPAPAHNLHIGVLATAPSS
jgi:hypothetical protein